LTEAGDAYNETSLYDGMKRKFFFANETCLM